MAKVAQSFEVTGGFPIDARYVLYDINELYSEQTWGIYNKKGVRTGWKTYEGLLVTVVDITKTPPYCELYLCTCFDDPTNLNSWRKISPSEISWNDEIEHIPSES